MSEAIIPSSGSPVWSRTKRVAFRFLFAYLVLYNLPFPITLLPGGEWLATPWIALWNALVPWVGELVFGVTITVFPNGSGDTTFNYVQVFTFAVIALVITLLWSVRDRRRREYIVLHRWLHAAMRFVLAVTMLGYGLVKVFLTQFGAPNPDRLLSTYGDSSPQGLLWTFMGASAGYCIFTGLAECASAILLTMRRTMLLGSLLCIAVMANVVMLNFCYDVPVKLYSLHLLAMAVFVVSPHFRRLIDFFLLNKSAPPALMTPLFNSAALHQRVLIARTIAVMLVVGFAIRESWQVAQQYGPAAPKPPLHGIWNVEKFEADGQPVPPLLTDTKRWRRLVFSRPGATTVHLIDDQRSHYTVQLDEKAGTLTLTKGPEDKTNWKANFTLARPKANQLTLDGTFENQKLHIEFNRQPESKSVLISRGFHWINEYTFYR